MKRIAVFIPRLGTAATTVVCIALTPLLFASQPALTIYNQNFAVVRDTVPIDLKQGINNVRFNRNNGPPRARFGDFARFDRQNEPANPRAKLSQRSRFAGVTVVVFEGKTIDFLVVEPNKPNTIVQGKIVRSGYARHSQEAMQRYGQRYAMAQSAMAYQSGGNVTADRRSRGQTAFCAPGSTPVFRRWKTTQS